MPILLALTLALDQRIELQLALLVMLGAAAALRRERVAWQFGKAAMVLGFAALYLVANSVITWTDPYAVPDNWWAAPVRIWLFYGMLVVVAALMKTHRFDAEAVFRTVEWLFLIKVLIVALEGYTLLATGEPRERPLFNIVLDEDTLTGARFTSSYDFLFALLALSGRHPARRLTLLAAAIVISETRALLLLSLLFLEWRLWVARSPWALLAAAAVPLATATAVVALLASAGEGASPRVLQISGSSLDDKLEQVEAASKLIDASPYLITGRGLGATMPGIVRDELRPYSYEAQVPVILWQGGLLFFVVYLTIAFAYVGSHGKVATALLLALGFLNPTLFALASAFFLTAFGKALDSNVHTRLADDRDPGLHAQR
jgi:hypothetical protein